MCWGLKRRCGCYQGTLYVQGPLNDAKIADQARTSSTRTWAPNASAWSRPAPDHRGDGEPPSLCGRVLRDEHTYGRREDVL